jgi:hypothetical protein
LRCRSLSLTVGHPFQNRSVIEKFNAEAAYRSCLEQADRPVLR